MSIPTPPPGSTRAIPESITVIKSGRFLWFAHLDGWSGGWFAFTKERAVAKARRFYEKQEAQARTRERVEL